MLCSFSRTTQWAHRTASDEGIWQDRDTYNLKSHKYVCVITYQPDTKSNPSHSPNPSPTN